MMSTEVLISRPEGGNWAGSAVTAAFAWRVKPVQVTVTAPAARVAPGFRVSVMAFVPYATVLAAVAVEEMAQRVPAGVTRLAGNVRMTVFVATRGVEVTKEIVAVPVVPTAVLRVKADAATAVTHPTQGVLT